MLHVTFRGGRYILPHFIIFLERFSRNIFEKQVYFLPLIPKLSKYSTFALNFFIEIILLFRMIWWSLTMRESLILMLFRMFFHAFGVACVSCNYWKWNVWYFDCFTSQKYRKKITKIAHTGIRWIPWVNLEFYLVFDLYMKTSLFSSLHKFI